MIINSYEDSVKFFKEVLNLDVIKNNDEISIIEDGEESMRFNSIIQFIVYSREVRDSVQFLNK